MRNRWLAAFAAVMFAGFAATAITVSAGASPENPSRHIVQVTKIVEGDEALTEGASFVVNVDCGEADYDLAFDDDGGTDSVEVGTWLDGPQTCVVTEPEDGGASDVEGVPYTCEFPGTEESSASLIEEPIYPDVICTVEVENSFDPPVTTTTVAPEPPVIVEEPVLVPVPILVTPEFTG